MTSIRNNAFRFSSLTNSTSSTNATSSTNFTKALQQASQTTGSSGDSSFEPSGGPQGGGKPPFLDAAAKSLGMTSDELDSKLKSGESLSSIAKEQGVSTDTVTSAIAADFKSKHPDATDSEASSVASKVLEGPPARPEDASSTESTSSTQSGKAPPFLSAAAEALGMSTDELSTELKSGKSLSSIASAQGVSTDTLKSALAADFTSKHPDATSSEASTAAEQAISGQPPLRNFKVSELQLRQVQA